MSTKLKNILTRGLTGLFVFATVVSILGNVQASAAQITGRSVTISNSAASQSGVTYQFDFTVPSATAIQAIDFQSCTTLSSCGTPVGVGSATLASQPTGLGAGSAWAGDFTTPGSLRIKHTTNTTAPSGAQRVIFNNVTNPSATGTFFFKITTYSASAFTGAIDTGNVATSTAGVIQVTAAVEETLTFTVTAATVALGTLSTSTTASGTSVMSAATNANTGYSITVNGSTLTSGAFTIPAMASATTSSTNSQQFGINLMANTTPSVGSAKTGSATGVPAAGYNTANTFKFVNGDTVATAGAPTNATNYTVSYIANIDSLQKPGAYSTNLTYVAIANF